ncbi:hypothetical protein CDCA_CDCA12G3520 [Cyanidium caldarium]|uniref:Uncharacterized protein n=1 Tax=Cyanidium caldarium TaxID=2771 RepID=A0AAV9IZK5_CYACA|nr:hypothetical protein CDCA_CDCA12G3520 [Cyanidium caldarium]
MLVREVRERECSARARAWTPTLSEWERAVLQAGGHAVTEAVALDLDGQSRDAVRSTIAMSLSGCGTRFASTHGDHSVRVFERTAAVVDTEGGGAQLPLRVSAPPASAWRLRHELRGHPRTPWSVRYHPHDREVVVSGCLGGECRVWRGPVCVARLWVVQPGTERSPTPTPISISCVVFDPGGEQVLLAARDRVLAWTWRADAVEQGAVQDAVRAAPTATVSDGAVTMPLPAGATATTAVADRSANTRLCLRVDQPIHLIRIPRSGGWMMVGVRSPATPPPTPRTGAAAPGSGAATVPFTLDARFYAYPLVGETSPTPRMEDADGAPAATLLARIPQVIAYNEAGVAVSDGGHFLAVCRCTHSPSPSEHVVDRVGGDDASSAHLVLYEWRRSAPGPPGMYPTALPGRASRKEAGTAPELSACASAPLDAPRCRALTNLRLSLASQAADTDGGAESPRYLHLLAGYSFRDPLDRYRAADGTAFPVFELYRIDRYTGAMWCVRVIDTTATATGISRTLCTPPPADDDQLPDEVNCALFLPNRHGNLSVAAGIVYGTQRGDIRCVW